MKKIGLLPSTGIQKTHGVLDEHFKSSSKEQVEKQLLLYLLTKHFKTVKGKDVKLLGNKYYLVFEFPQIDDKHE